MHCALASCARQQRGGCVPVPPRVYGLQLRGGPICAAVCRHIHADDRLPAPAVRIPCYLQQQNTREHIGLQPLHGTPHGGAHGNEVPSSCKHPGTCGRTSISSRGPSTSEPGAGSQIALCTLVSCTAGALDQSTLSQSTLGEKLL